MMKPVFFHLAWIAMLISGTSAAHAGTISTEGSCASAQPDIWGEDKPDVTRHDVDGAQIESMSDFKHMIVKRSAGVSIVRGGDFSGWDFSTIPLSGICFEQSKLDGANFANAIGSGVGFIKSDLTGANMKGARMPGIMFRNAGLTDVTATGADFSNGRFDGGWFEGNIDRWNLDGANMTGFTFDCGITLTDGCPVYQGGAGMSAKGADMHRATLHSFGLYNVDMTDARLDQTIIGPRQLPYLKTAEFRGGILLRGGDSDVQLTAEEAQNLMSENSKQKAKEAQPAFDCGKAASKVEKEICGEYSQDLRAMDRKLSSLYKKARAGNAGVRASQRAWLKQRNRCGASEYPMDCLRETYSKRIGVLLGLMGRSEWLGRGEAALFIGDILPVSEDFADSDLYSKITPALIGASMNEILIERGKDGLYQIKGSAVGANAHLCSLYASHLYLDRKSGWYIPVSETAAVPIFRIIGNRLEIFANGRPDYKEYPEASNFMSCGMRAGFSETVRVDADDAVIERYRKSLNEEM
ncbi:MAG: pentapeptide repeat-containing protein [Sphingorhabdus sp.]